MHVMITGASRGLGSAIAECCRFRGDSLLTASIRSGNTSIVGCLSNPATIDECVRIVNSAGGIDVLVNNAAVRLPESDGMDYLKTITINLLAPMLLTQALWPGLSVRKGVVVNINSLAAFEPGPGEVAYATSKAGLAGYSRALQFDAARDGVRVINVVLGAMQTDMTKDREDWDSLMDPTEVAGQIVRLFDHPKVTAGITELTIKRRNY